MVVREQCAGAKIMTRSSPVASPTIALMARKCVTTTVSVVIDRIAPNTRSRNGSHHFGRVDTAPLHERAQPGGVIRHRIGRCDQLADPGVDGRSRRSNAARSGAAVSRVRRKGDTMIGNGPRSASTAATAAACSWPRSSRPGSGSCPRSHPASRVSPGLFEPRPPLAHAGASGSAEPYPGRPAADHSPMNAKNFSPNGSSPAQRQRAAADGPVHRREFRGASEVQFGGLRVAFAREERADAPFEPRELLVVGRQHHLLASPSRWARPQSRPTPAAGRDAPTSRCW